MNNPSSSKGKPWIDLNRLPDELLELPDDSVNQDPDELLEQPNESSNFDSANLQIPQVEPNVYKTIHLSIPLTLSQEKLESKFLEIKGRPWDKLNPFSNETIERKKRHAFCYQIWTRLNGPLDFRCTGRTLPMDRTRYTISIGKKDVEKVNKMDILSCACTQRGCLGKHDTVHVIQYSDMEYFILVKSSTYAVLNLITFLSNIDPLDKVIVQKDVPSPFKNDRVPN